MFLRIIPGAALAALVIFGTAGANAQDYPQRPIRMIVSIAAGSVTDVIMRAAINEIKLGQPIVIEKRDVMAAFRRSRDLVKGFGWAVFGTGAMILPITWSSP